MKYGKTWGTFFTTATAVVVGGLTMTALFSRNMCSSIAKDTVGILQKIFENDGTIKFDIIFGDRATKLQDLTDDSGFAIYIKMNEQLVESIKSMPEYVVETACNAVTWQAGTQDVVLALLLIAAACGVVFTFNHSQKEEPRVLLEQDDDLHFSPV